MGKNIGYLFIIVILLVEVPRFMSAFAVLDNTPLTALGTGIAMSGGSMYIFHTWWTSARKRRNWLLVPFGVNLLLAGLILIPWGMGQLRVLSISQLLGNAGAWLWVSVVVLSPFALVAGVTTAMAFQKEPGRKRSETVGTASEQVKTKPNLTEQQRAVVAAYQNGATTLQQVADAVGIGKTTAQGKVTKLIEMGILERTDSGIVVHSDNGNG